MFKLVVLSCALAVAVASPSAIGPLGLGLGLAAPWGAPLLAGPWGHGLAAAPAAVAWGAPVLGAYNYRGPLSLAPGQPASILAADGRPLDTLSVNLDRAAHITAKAVDGHGLHILKKRSAPLLAPYAVSHTARIDIPSRLIGHSPLALPAVAPLGLRAPWGLGHLGGPVGPWGVAAPWGHLW